MSATMRKRSRFSYSRHAVIADRSWSKAFDLWLVTPSKATSAKLDYRVTLSEFARSAGVPYTTLYSRACRQLKQVKNKGKFYAKKIGARLYLTPDVWQELTKKQICGKK